MEAQDDFGIPFPHMALKLPDVALVGFLIQFRMFQTRHGRRRRAELQQSRTFNCTLTVSASCIRWVVNAALNAACN